MRFLSSRRLAGTALLSATLGLAAHAYAGTHPCPTLAATLQNIRFDQLTDARVMHLALAPVTGTPAPARAEGAPTRPLGTVGYLGMYEHYLELTGRSLMASAPDADTRH